VIDPSIQKLLEGLLAPEPYQGSGNLLEAIGHGAEARGLKFRILKKPTSSNDRSAFVIYREETDSKCISGGYIVQTSKNKEYEDKGWNRMSPEEKKWMKKISALSKNFYVIMIWPDPDCNVFIPLSKLEKTERFTRTGNFTVIKEGQNFKLQGLQEESGLEGRNMESTIYRLTKA
jgi:hypothetical protein